jgi:hypothetical protein
MGIKINRYQNQLASLRGPRTPIRHGGLTRTEVRDLDSEPLSGRNNTLNEHVGRKKGVRPDNLIRVGRYSAASPARKCEVSDDSASAAGMMPWTAWLAPCGPTR